MSDECRPVDVEVDGETETIRVHGGTAPNAEDIRALAELVQAARARLATLQTVRQRAHSVLREHWPVNGRCTCGASAYNATLWSVHVGRALEEAGVLLPDQPAEEQP